MLCISICRDDHVDADIYIKTEKAMIREDGAACDPQKKMAKRKRAKEVKEYRGVRKQAGRRRAGYSVGDL